jgi:hypothetical protein
MGFDCGHICCDIRDNCNHSHPIEPDECAICEQVRRTGIRPSITTTEQALGEQDIHTPLRSYETDSGHED